MEDEEINTEIEEAGTFRADIKTAIATLDELLRNKDSTENTSTKEKEMTHQTSTPDTRVIRAKLPKLEVREFDGKPEQWQEFWDGFENSVHSNPNLSAIDKVRFKQRCTICQSPEVASRSSVKSAKQAGHCLRQWNVWNVSECPQRTTSWECFC